MQIEVTYTTSGDKAAEWPHDSILREEVMQRIVNEFGRIIRVRGLVAWETRISPAGEFEVHGFLCAEAGSPQLTEHSVNVGPPKKASHKAKR